jgi:hypothetical protein
MFKKMVEDMMLFKILNEDSLLLKKFNIVQNIGWDLLLLSNSTIDLLLKKFAIQNSNPFLYLHCNQKM